MIIEEELIDVRLKEDLKFVKISKLCNNRCLFCCDTIFQDGRLFTAEAVMQELREGRLRGLTKVLFTGGEPTVHPDFTKFIQAATDLGYKRVAVVTNGRRFAYAEFCKTAVRYGLNEAVFSIHGPDKRIHDRIVGVPNAFRQATAGLWNLGRYRHVRLSAVIIVNRINYRLLPRYVTLMRGFSVRGITFMNVTLTGRAADHRQTLAFDVNKALPYLRTAISLCVRHGISPEVRKFPPNFLENREELICDPDDFIREVLENDRTRRIFSAYTKENVLMPCWRKGCSRCFFHRFCRSLVRHKKRFDAGWTGAHSRSFDGAPFSRNGTVMEIRSDTAPRILRSRNKIEANRAGVVFSVRNHPTLDEARRGSVELRGFFKALGVRGLRLAKMPKCFWPYSVIVRAQAPPDFLEGDGTMSIEKFARFHFLNEYYCKSLRCRMCVDNAGCDGMHINYLRVFGFSSLKPIRTLSANPRFAASASSR